MSHCVNKQEEIKSDFLLTDPKGPLKGKGAANEAHGIKVFEPTRWSQLLNKSPESRSAVSSGVLLADLSSWHLPGKV